MKYLPNKAQTRGLSQHNQVIIFKKNNKNARGINDQASCAVFFFIQRHIKTQLNSVQSFDSPIVRVLCSRNFCIFFISFKK